MIRLLRQQLPLLFIIFGAFAIRVYQFQYNSPFLDEAIYILLGQKILAGNYAAVNEATSWVGGFPFFYPFFTGFSYKLGGIVGSRLFNTILGVICVWLIAQFTQVSGFFPQMKQNKAAGLWAAMLLATLPVPIFLSRFATYDMLAYTWYLVGLTLLAYAMKKNSHESAFLAAIAIFLALIAKYIVAIAIVPLGLWVLFMLVRKQIVMKQKWILQEFSLVFVFLCLLYTSLTYEDVWQYVSDQASGTRGDYTEVLINFWKYSWIPYAVALGSLFIRELRTRLTVAMILASLFPFGLHFMTRNSTAMIQHSFLSLIYLLPVVGAVCAYVVSQFTWKGLLYTGSVTTLVLGQALSDRYELEHFWPNSTQAVMVLKRIMSPQDTILAESDDVVALALAPEIEPSQITGPFYFSYKNQEGYTAYKTAIEDRYFTYIEFDNNFFPETERVELETLLTGRYEQVFTDQHITIYRRIE